MKVLGKNRKPTKQSISNPIPQTITPSNGKQSQTTPVSEDSVSFVNTTTGAANLSTKLTNLMTAASSAVSEAPVGYQDDTMSSIDGRSRRLQRGKKAVVKAGKAIAERFSNSKGRGSRKLTKDNDAQSLADYNLSAHVHQDTDDTDWKRQSRRIAEGSNLNNPKIRALTGDGNIPRKPLPVYESMRRLAQTEQQIGDGVSSKHHSRSSSFMHGFPGLSFELNNRKSRPTSLQEPLMWQSYRGDIKRCKAEPAPTTTEQTARFSEKISGLAQHPDVDFFSSSPDGYSTPRMRLEPTYTADGTKRLTAVPATAPMILDFSSEENETKSSADELASTPETEVAESLNLKRKSAKEDLRSTVTPPSKKSKSSQTPSREDMMLASSISKLDTGSNGALHFKDTNQKVSRGRREGSRGRGLGIFDTGRSKESPSPHSDAVKKLRRRHSKRSSIPKPVSKISARERRASSALMCKGTGLDSSADVDDLQLDLSDYNVGAKRS